MGWKMGKTMESGAGNRARQWRGALETGQENGEGRWKQGKTMERGVGQFEVALLPWHRLSKRVILMVMAMINKQVRRGVYSDKAWDKEVGNAMQQTA